MSPPVSCADVKIYNLCLKLMSLWLCLNSESVGLEVKQFEVTDVRPNLIDETPVFHDNTTIVSKDLNFAKYFYLFCHPKPQKSDYMSM